MEQLLAQKRDIIGKKVAMLRTQGFVPAVVYGGKDGNRSITVSMKEFQKIWKTAGESTLVNLQIEGDGTKSVLIHEVVVHPVKGLLVHVDFFEARADHAIKIHIPLVFRGESPAVKILGGVLVKVVHSLEVEALPKDLPHEIIVDISSLTTFDDTIALRDISLPKQVILHGKKDEIIAKVAPPRSDEEMARLEETQAVNLDEIQVTERGKKEEEPTEESEQTDA